MNLLFPAPPPICLTILPEGTLFPIRRIFCIGRNYEEHAREMGVVPERTMPFFFQKSPESVVAQHRLDEPLTIRYPPATTDLHYEAELVVALGQGGQNIAPAQALAHIFGYAIGLDMTRRDLQALLKERRWPWDMAKNFTDSAPIGVLHPIATTGELDHGRITLDVNGSRKQQGDIQQMIWSVNEMIAELSRMIALAPGDLLFTGTPAGVGRVTRQETLQIQIEPLGRLEVTVV
ncbi:MAG: fumarylacetoacetate hydrolase family protein [Magnetococcales bacterium]|nr:fumarylacetoacetate hydrolase family protein [Magnetococcales bacterium]